MKQRYETIDSVHPSVEDDLAHQLTTTMTDEGLHHPEVTAPEVIERGRRAVDGLHHMMSTTTEAMPGGLHQETTVHHHQGDMMTHTKVEALRLLLEATSPTLG